MFDILIELINHIVFLNTVCDSSVLLQMCFSYAF